MILESNNIDQLSQLALNAARKAALYIQSQVHTNHQINLKEGIENLATQVVTAIDVESQRLILDQLEPSLQEFDLGLLTEESPDDGSRFTKDYFWCVDPLDGTLPFTEQQPGYAVSIALISRAGEPIIGVVIDPYHDVEWLAIKGRGVHRNSKPFKIVSESDVLICRMERSFLNSSYYDLSLQALDRISRDLGFKGFEIRTGYGAVMNALSLLETGGCFFKFPKLKKGGGCTWDYAATHLIYQELGFQASDIYGQSLALNNRESLYMNQRGVIYGTDANLVQRIISLYQTSSGKAS